jgi:membrane associated rhomboid family serine protease
MCLAAQIGDPTLLRAMERDAGRIRGGEWYRLVTALFFQDGWLLGGTWNIVVLGILGSLAEQMLERWRWVAVYSISAIGAEFVALNWQPIGAGNSVAAFGLSGAVIVCALQRRSDPSVPMFASVTSGVAAVLAFSHDIHGAAFAIGVLIALVLTFLV